MQMQPADDRPMAPPVTVLLKRHRPWEELQDTAIAIIDDTYAAALQIVGGTQHEAAGADRGVVKLARPIDPADPDSPVLTVHAGASHCCIAFNNTRGDAEAFLRYTCPRGKSSPTHCLDRVTISISTGTLHLARVHDRHLAGGYRSRVDQVESSRRELAILDAIMWRLDTAMGEERELLIKASAAKCGSSPKVAEISEVFKVLGEMRNEMDLDAVNRRRLQKRRCPLQEAAVARPDQAEHADGTEALTKRLKTLRVCSSPSLHSAEGRA
ncbi:hypothetical protein D1007_50567 [Hordeum vulgare]|nr:hypothetical protein D1007_50567 [Hordeum vulgare]